MRLAAVLFGDFRISVLKTLRLHARRRRVLVGRGYVVKHARNLHMSSGSRLSLGIRPYGFARGNDRGLLRLRGDLTIRGQVTMASGCRIDVGPGASLTIGNGSYLSPYVRVIASLPMTIGERCAIGWDVQILDDDFHDFVGDPLAPARSSHAPVQVGNDVWIGSHARLYKGVSIADGCVVAGSAVVTKSIVTPHALVAGNPARVVRENVSWS